MNVAVKQPHLILAALQVTSATTSEVPEYSIERHAWPFRAVDLITDDAVYTVDFDGIELDEVCTITVYDEDGEIVYQDDKFKTPDWAHYSAAPALQGDNY